MFLTRTECDRSVNTFSPEGRLFQVEYAIEAIKLGSTAIRLRTKEGVVLAVEKRVTSPLLVCLLNLPFFFESSIMESKNFSLLMTVCVIRVSILLGFSAFFNFLS
ncbi:unnamed protein product [Musa textilis]